MNSTARIVAAFVEALRGATGAADPAPEVEISLPSADEPILELQDLAL